MALTHTRAKELADECQEISTKMVDLLSRVERFLLKNSNLSVSWTADPKPSYLNEDAAGNIDGTKFTRAQLSNAIGAVDKFRALLRNEVASQGDYLGVLNQLADVPLEA